MQITKWSRICPKCKGIIYHINEKQKNRAEKEGRSCGGKANLNCKTIPKKFKVKLKNLWAGEAPHHDQSNRRKKSEPTEFSRACPRCNKILYYSDYTGMRYAEKRGKLCDSCNRYKYKHTWNDVITEDSIKKMRASKAGFSSWKEYQEKMPLWKQYKAKVWSITYNSLKSNPILENFNKRGRCGVNGAYQIDHIIGIKSGFENSIPAEEIGKYSNLRMLPWKENRNKG